MKYFIGIDPGVSGAIAILNSEGQLAVFNAPTVEMKVGKALKRRISPEILVSMLQPFTIEASAWVEQVSARPGQGVSSMFAFGESYGLVKGILAGLQIQTNTVTPNAWKKAMQLNAGKDASRAKAAQMWPQQAGEFSRVKDDGKAEAALIAEYGRRHTF